MKFDPPIQFPVRVSGKRVIAIIDEQIGSVDQFVLKVHFNDGFSDSFFHDEYGNFVGSSEVAKPYEASMKKDIGILIGIEKEQNYFILEEVIDNAITNVWIFNRSSPTAIVYAVYYNNMYRFELKRSDKVWIAFSKSKLNAVIDQTIRQRVEGFLNNELSLE